MNNKILLTAVFLLLLFFVVACAPTEFEPESADRLPSRIPPPTTFPETTLPSSLEATSTVTVAPFSLPLRPEDAPAMLPVYLMTPDPVPDTVESALAWAQSFGLTNADVREENEETISLLSLDETGNFYEQLSFQGRPFNDEAIVYSSGIYWQNFNGPTPTPDMEALTTLSQEMVLDIALAFVRELLLLPEPVIAHEFPSSNEQYIVHVAFAPEGLRLTGIGQETGVTVWIDGSGRVVQARIVPANFVAVEPAAVQPLNLIYPDFIRGEVQNVFYYERTQFGSLQPDPMRFQAHSVPYSDQGDRAELVYVPLPAQPDRIVPMWLITRPHEQSWDHYDEYYLAAILGENIPRPHPTMTPLAQTNVVPESLEIIPPLLVESEDGRLFTNAVLDGITHTVSLDAERGDLLAVFGLTGGLALDDGRNQLFVDKHPYGLTVIDTTTGEVMNEIQIPAGERSHASVQADPASGNVLLFRDQMLLIADPLSETWQQTVPFTVEGTVCDEPMERPPVIEQTWFDSESRLLYLSFIDYVCTPWVSYTVVVYDVNTMSEVSRYPDMDYMSGTAVNGRFYGKSWFRLGQAFQWAWLDGLPWLEQTERGEDYIGAFSGFQVDENRGWLYEMTVDGLQILDMEAMTVVETLPAPIDGHLAGFDPATDNLYFVEEENGRLFVWPAENIQN